MIEIALILTLKAYTLIGFVLTVTHENFKDISLLKGIGMCFTWPWKRYD